MNLNEYDHLCLKLDLNRAKRALKLNGHTLQSRLVKRTSSLHQCSRSCYCSMSSSENIVPLLQHKLLPTNTEPLLSCPAVPSMKTATFTCMQLQWMRTHGKDFHFYLYWLLLLLLYIHLYQCRYSIPIIRCTTLVKF